MRHTIDTFRPRLCFGASVVREIGTHSGETRHEVLAIQGDIGQLDMNKALETEAKFAFPSLLKSAHQVGSVISRHLRPSAAKMLRFRAALVRPLIHALIQFNGAPDLEKYVLVVIRVLYIWHVSMGR